MLTEAEKAKEERAEKHARTIRTVGITAAIVSVFSFLGTAGVASQNIEQSIKNTDSSLGVSKESLCLSWVSFVLQQQSSPAMANMKPDAIDTALDRLGAVAYARVEAEKDWQIADVPRQFAVVPGPAVVPTGPVQLKSITAHCGSAHELRMARETNDPLVLNYNING